MPKVALADTVDDWEQLSGAAAPYGDVKNLKVQLAELQGALLRLRELKALREQLQAQRQAATQEMYEVREAGKLAAIQVRSMLKGILGHDNPKLTQFNMRPRRSRRKHAPAVPDNLAPSE